MSIVLDCSTTLAWVYSDEVTHAVRDVFSVVTAKGCFVPALWRLEVVNALQMGVRRGRCDASFRDATLADLAMLPMHVDYETDTHAWGATLRLAERHRLTSYDAAYLELALRRALPLATQDSELRAAAKAENVILMGL